MKKLLSIIIAITILASVLPVAFAVEADMGTIEYVFNCGAFESSSVLSITKAYAKTQDDVASGYNKWNIEGLSWVLDTSKLNTECLYLHAAEGRVATTSTAVIAAAIVLDIDKTGSFSTSITYIPEKSAPIYNIYLVKKGNSDNIAGFTTNGNNAELTTYISKLNEAKLLGTVNMYSTDSTPKTEPLKTVNITETGDYYLILAENGADDSFEANTDLHTNGRVTTKLCSFGLTPVKSAIEYVFSYEAFDENSNIKNADIVSKTQDDIADGYNKWNIEGVSQVRDGSAIQENALYLYGSTNRVDPTKDSTIAVAIVLDITETGTFTPKLTYTGRPNSPKYKVYFAKKKTGVDVSGWCNGSEHNKNNEKLNDYIATLTDAEHLGEVETYAAMATEDMFTELNTLNITETGAYYLILADNNINSDAGTIEEVETHINSFTLTPANENEAVVDAFAVDSNTPASHSASIKPTYAALDGSTITASVSADDEDGDGVYTVTAPATDTSGDYKFLYWIKGLTQDTANKIVSLASTIEEYKPQNGANYLIAVYEKADSESSAEPKFYNGNGQLLDDLKLGENGELPALPSMAGYGNAKEWEKHNDFIYVAQYDDFTVKVNGKDVTYGDSVTFTADPDTDEKYFKWWQRTANGVTEIVSVDREYTLCPWEDCTVEAVYGDTKQIMAGNLRKIVLDVLGSDSIMAEFIGLDGAEVAEKGIILTNSEGTKKIAMSTNNSQFTITNNISATSASGYAIIKDGETVTEITDGSITLD